MSKSASWLTDRYSPYDLRRHKLRKILVRARTRFQKAVLADSYSFGRCLVLDQELQSAQRDEFIYHEALVHPAMALHPNPKEVLILGGGEGATAREILRHPPLKRVTMVDIDGEVVEFCKKYLKSWHQGAFHNPKTQLIIDDANRFISETKTTFDIIFSDLPTPASAREPIAALYSESFYRRLLSKLKPGGLLVVQSGSGHLLQMEFHTRIGRILQKLFPIVRPYFVFVPSFDEPWAFLLASRGRDPAQLLAQQVNDRLGNLSKTLRFYDGQTHEGLFRIPKYLRTL